MNKNKILLTAATVALLGGSLLTSTKAFAQDVTVEANPMPSLVQKISEKFGLNQDEVQAVFDESKAEMEANFQAEYKTRLTQLVSNGEITEEQKQLIIAKNTELQKNRKASMESMKDKTAEERKTAMEAERTALQDWATQNGIDLKYLMMGGHGKGPGRPGMRGAFPPQAPDWALNAAPTQTVE